MGLALTLPSCSDPEANKTYEGSDEELLVQINAKNNETRTIRFPEGPIKVYVENIPDGRDEVREWSRQIPNLEFDFVGHVPSSGIVVQYGIHAPIVCGATYEPDWEAGVIKKANITIDPKAIIPASLLGCTQTIRHEIGHALGLFGHLQDGGLMDPDGGNGEFTDQLKSLISRLYAFPPNSAISTLFPPE